MRIETDLKLDYSDVLIRPKRSTLTSRKEVTLERTYTFRNSGKVYKGIPIMAANMDGVGTFEMAQSNGIGGLFTCLVKNYSVQDLIQYFNTEGGNRYSTALSIGTSDYDLQKLKEVYYGISDLSQLKYLCVDVANGYTKTFVDTIRTLRESYPGMTIIAGNVVTADQTQELILNGADIVKVGIGPGSVCTTRIQTGVGYPQLSAVIECADAAHGLGGHIIADGGCTCPGDVAKAFAAGADFVMLGGMLAGHDEGGGEIITKIYETDEVIETGEAFNKVYREKQFVQFYGMSSDAANTKHFGGLKDYRSSEGREVLVPYKGSLSATVQDLLGGIRSTCTYVGANNLKQLSKCTTFVRCNNTHNRIFENK